MKKKSPNFPNLIVTIKNSNNKNGQSRKHFAPFLLYQNKIVLTVPCLSYSFSICSIFLFPSLPQINSSNNYSNIQISSDTPIVTVCVCLKKASCPLSSFFENVRVKAGPPGYVTLGKPNPRSSSIQIEN